MHLVQHKKSNETFAMKILNKNLLIRRSLVNQMLKEIYIVSQIRHESIVQFKGSFEDK